MLVIIILCSVMMFLSLSSLSLQASLDGRISKLEQTLDRVGSTRERLRELLAQEEEWRERLEHHPSPRALPVDIERQLAEFSVSFNNCRVDSLTFEKPATNVNLTVGF